MERWKLKKILKIILIVFLSTSVLMTLVFLWNGESIDTAKNAIKVLGIFSLGSVLVALYMYWITNLIKKRNKQSTNIYYREIDSRYTPAIAAYIIDRNLEENEGVLGAILDLKRKGFLEIYNDEMITVIDKDVNELLSHEKYIINCFKENVKIEPITFNELVEKDCKTLNLVYKTNKFATYEKNMAILRFVLLLLAIFSYSIEKYEALIIFIILLVLLIAAMYIISFIKLNIKLTGMGADAAVKFNGLKNYLRDYSLLGEKDIDYQKFIDIYLPYCVALGEAKNIEDKYFYKTSKLIQNYINCNIN